MVRHVITIFVFISVFPISIYANTWLGGFNLPDAPGVYGTLGTPDPANFPGARRGGACWTYPNGDLGLFGGLGYPADTNDGTLNDLWCYDGTNWTWQGGSNTSGQPGVYGTRGQADSNNIPGAREGAASWVDQFGNVWLFAGEGVDAEDNSGYLNDLWKYDGTNWTWMSGSDVRKSAGSYGTLGIAHPDNLPPARIGAASWMDAQGDLYLFGGWGLDSSGSGFIVYLNDLWKYDISENLWTWMAGSNIGNNPGTYGDKGIPDSANIPGARKDSVVWKLSNGQIYLFGGAGIDAMAMEGAKNDLWKFDGGNWTWVAGSSQNNMPGNFGAKGITDPSNQPHPRWDASGWVADNDTLWLQGGMIYLGGFVIGGASDIWKYDGSNWTWMSGSDALNQPGVYGTQGTDDPANFPGSRYGSMAWVATDGRFYLFGGAGNGANYSQGVLNDLWIIDQICYPPDGDLDGDCVVNLNDVAILSSQWIGNLDDLAPLCDNWLQDNR